MSAIPPNSPIPEKKRETASTQSSPTALKGVAQEKIRIPKKEIDLSGKKVTFITNTIESPLTPTILEYLTPEERLFIRRPLDAINFDINKKLLFRYQTDPAFSGYIPKQFQGRDPETLTETECTECVLRTNTERKNALNSSLIKMLPEFQKEIPSMGAIDLSLFFTNKEKAEAILRFLIEHPEECSQVSKLNFEGFALKEVHPEMLKLFPNVTGLSLNGCNLTFIPPEIKYLKDLELLYCGNNNLSLLPDEIGSLKKLITLWLPKNQLAVLPPGIKNLTSLTHLWLSWNRFEELPSVIQSFKKLQCLVFSNNFISTIPDWIGSMSNLEYLELENNRIPLDIGNLSTQIPQCRIAF